MGYGWNYNLLLHTYQAHAYRLPKRFRRKWIKLPPPVVKCVQILRSEALLQVRFCWFHIWALVKRDYSPSPPQSPAPGLPLPPKKVFPSVSTASTTQPWNPKCCNKIARLATRYVYRYVYRNRGTGLRSRERHDHQKILENGSWGVEEALSFLEVLAESTPQVVLSPVFLFLGLQSTPPPFP